jgi:hypothetical protein
VWWLSDLRASDDLAQTRGGVAEVDARSYARPDPTHTTHRRGDIIWQFDPTPGAVAEQIWRIGPVPARQPALTLLLRGVGSLTVDLLRAGFAPGEKGTVSITTDGACRVTLRGLARGTKLELDGIPTTGPELAIPQGRHRLTFSPSPARNTGTPARANLSSQRPRAARTS